jgi:hypothetical protein
VASSSFDCCRDSCPFSAAGKSSEFLEIIRDGT